jgi:uncharacterized protein
MRLRPLLFVVLGLLALGFILFFVSFSFAPDSPPQNQTVDSPAGFRYEIATSTKARTQGLSGRMSMPENAGLLFVFPEPGSYGFWMKDMLIPIDIIWIDDAGLVVKVDADVDPSTYPTVFHPPLPVRYVLETAAGEAARQGWGAGSRISLPF